MKTKITLVILGALLTGIGCQKSDNSKSSAGADTVRNTSAKYSTLYCGAKSSLNVGIYGVWASPKLTNITTSDGKISATLYMIIDQDKVSVVAVCKNKKTNADACAVASAQAKIDETNKKIEITSSMSDEDNNNDGDVRCSANIKQGVMNYTQSGNTITFHDDVEGDLEMTRQ
ncbi:MAG: hypothetical protein L6Q37_02055 [Bdellovibrionaceae bacterium]|nr:hypothetical protein [Pseudobdellovibrionaceae bacterium]NUM58462.1 hypothetical protein [Pseudobdellovibrionaceae bacterium]